MKGIVFTEFLEMVEGAYGLEMVDTIVTKSNVPSKGVYTAVGTYSHNEIIDLVVALSEETKTPVPDLVKIYGEYLFGTFSKSYPTFFANCDTSFDFLEQIESYIHPEVQKLYPDAQLPKFETKRIGDNTLIMIYTSPRKMYALAQGLIEKTLVYFQQKGNLITELLNEDGSKVKFTITLLNE